MISSQKKSAKFGVWTPLAALQPSNACKRNCCQRLSSKLPRPHPLSRPSALNMLDMDQNPTLDELAIFQQCPLVLHPSIHHVSPMGPLTLGLCPSFFAPNDQSSCRRVHAPQQATAKEPRVPRVSAQATRTCWAAMATLRDII